ncbi:MAG: type II secretion system secretin GspD [Alphaproteobacteria bacterium]|nr:type II secretion system secretin GspD [Alphaproteobacteria bacterium]
MKVEPIALLPKTGSLSAETGSVPIATDDNRVKVPPRNTVVVPGSGSVVGPVGAGAAKAPVAETGDITLNFVDADIHEVVRSVLGDVLHLNYAIDPKLQSTVTVQTSRPLPRDQVLPAFEEVLRASGLALVETGGLWRVVPLDEAARNATPSVVLGQGGGLAEAGATVNMRILPLKYVAAATLRETLEPFLPKGALLQVDTQRNLLIVTGAKQDLATIDSLVSSFDVNWLSAMSFAIYPLETGSPRSAVRELNTIFRTGGNAPAVGGLRFEPLDDMNAVLVVSSQRAYLDEARRWIERLDRAGEAEEPRFYEYHVQNSRAVDLAKVMSDLLSSGAVHTVQPQTAPGTTPIQLSTPGAGGATGSGPTSGLPTSGTPGSGLFGGTTGGQTTPGYQQPGSMPIGTQSTGGLNASSSSQSSSGSLDSGLGTALSSGTGAGDEDLALPKVRIVADEKNNALVIFARPRDYRLIEDALQRLDVVPLQVLIEATIAEVTLNDNLQYGLQWFFNKGGNQFELSNATSGKGVVADIAGSFPGFNYILSGGNTALILSALSSLTRVDVVSAPQVLVLDHQTAALQVGDQVPIISQSAQSVITADAPIVNSVQYLNTGVVLQVTPRVNKTGLVTLDIDQAVSDVKTTTTSTINSPTITQRRIVTSAVMQDGETIALGGLILQNRNDDKSGLPILSNIPIVGNLFGTTSVQKGRTELLVLLTPKIVRNAAEARTMTNELRTRLNSISTFLGKPQ